MQPCLPPKDLGMGLHEMTWIVRSGEAVHARNNGPVWLCVALTCISADA